MIKLSNSTIEPAKSELIAAAKNIEGLTAGVELPAAGAGSSGISGEWMNKQSKAGYTLAGDGTIKTSWNTKGQWRWLNGSDRVVIGDYLDPKQRAWEFLPDGSVKSKGTPWGAWEWAKAADDSSIVIYRGVTGKGGESHARMPIPQFSRHDALHRIR